MSLRDQKNQGANSRRRRRTRRGSRQKEVKWLKHYSSDHRILLVGDGDFSFSLSLAMAFGSASKIVATSFDSMEEENPGPNQPNSRQRRRTRRGSRQKEVTWLKHYSSDHRILLVGEGDFSFSLSLAMAFGGASNIVATSLDSYDLVIKKYKAAKTNLEILHSLGAELLHEVDALQMKLHRDLQMQKFDRIIFNFPHAGCQQVIMKHRNLVCGFFKNASGMLLPKGEVHVTLKTSEYYQSWNIEELATQNSLTLLERIQFKLEDYPGYSNKRVDGERADEPFPLGECSTYKFVLFPKRAMGGGYPFSIKPAGPSNLRRSSPRRSNLPLSNPQVTNPFRLEVYRPPTSNPPSVTNPLGDDPNPLTDKELNWVYDYTFSQLRLQGRRIGVGNHPLVENPPTVPIRPHANPPLVENPRVTQEVPSWAEGYETDHGAEYIPHSDEEMVYDPEENFDDDCLHRNDGDSDCSSYDSLFGY